MRSVPKRSATTGDASLDALLDLQRTLLEEMRAELLAARAPDVQLLNVAGTIDASRDVVVYNGGGGVTVTMPTAKRAGIRKSRPLVVWNQGPGTLTLAAQAMETVDGAATKSVATGVKYRFDSDGDTRWGS